MRLQVQLVHAEPGVRVVLVSAWNGADCLGSALGEAAEAEEAERRAELRLRQRLQPDPLHQPPAVTDPVADTAAGLPAADWIDRDALPPLRSELPAPAVAGSEQPTPLLPSLRLQPSSQPATQPVAPQEQPVPGSPAAGAAPPVTRSPSPRPAAQVPVVTSGSGAVSLADPQVEPTPDPEDWSDDLARIDRELLRLGWGRGEEATYLERAFGHPSRSRLTRYGDLIAYLQSLGALEAGADPAQVALPLRRRDLLEQCDELLGRLGWSPDQGRQFLESHFQCTSRQHLSDQQLLQFNMLLEEQWLQQPSAMPA